MGKTHQLPKGQILSYLPPITVISPLLVCPFDSPPLLFVLTREKTKRRGGESKEEEREGRKGRKEGGSTFGFLLLFLEKDKEKRKEKREKRKEKRRRRSTRTKPLG